MDGRRTKLEWFLEIVRVAAVFVLCALILQSGMNLIVGGLLAAAGTFAVFGWPFGERQVASWSRKKDKK